MSILKIRNSSNTGWIDAQTAPGFRIRNQSNSGWIDKTGNLSGYSVRDSTNSGWLVFNNYSISPSASSVNEGGSVTYTVSTSGIANGTVMYWTNAGTSIGGDFTDGLNSGSVTINSNTAVIVRTLNNDLTTEGSETLILQLRLGSVSGTVVATSSTVTISDSSIAPTFPTSMVMERNDLEFIYSGDISSTLDTAYVEYLITLDTTNFWTLMPYATDHIVFALDAKGDSSVIAYTGTRDHCGPITRHGRNLFDEARGFILFRDGTLKSEHWFAGAGFGVYDFGFGFDPLLPENAVITIRIRAGYRNGPKGEKMEIDIFRGSNTGGMVLTGGSVPWGWDWTGQHRFVLGAICSAFNSPNDTGCVESTRLGTSYGATMNISNFSMTVIQ